MEIQNGEKNKPIIKRDNLVFRNRTSQGDNHYSIHVS